MRRCQHACKTAWRQGKNPNVTLLEYLGLMTEVLYKFRGSHCFERFQVISLMYSSRGLLRLVWGYLAAPL
jgi:hypothetical protein